MAGSVFDLDWRRISRWCLLGAIAMTLWLLAPVARCSFGAFRDTPIGSVADNDNAGQADKDRLEQGKGFWDGFIGGVKVCYARTPLTEQEGWKTSLLFTFAGVWIVAGLLARASRKPRTFT